MAEGHDEGADTYGVGVTGGGRRDPAARHADERKVGSTIRRDHVRVDVRPVCETYAKARGASDVRVRHDEIGTPYDARPAPAQTVDLDRYPSDAVGDLGQVRRRHVTRGNDAHRR